MGKVSILTKEQKVFLSVLKTNPYIMERFYFTGGTALAEYYLHHRYSDDLDFFSENTFDNQIINAIVEGWSKQLHFTYTARFIEVVYRFELQYPSGYKLKIDFAYYPYKRLNPSTIIDGIPIDSLFDIAVNKSNTISQRQTVKDFVDCYYLWKTESFYDLMHGIETKFHGKFDPIVYSSDLLSVDYFDTMPKMIKPLTITQLKKYYHKKATDLAKTAVE